MRGKHVSKPMDEIIAEAEELAADGVRELIIVAQDTTYYGMDLFGEPRLKELLERLEQVDGIQWIRLMYFYPMYVDDGLIRVLGASRKIVPYVDIPLQHINDVMLRRMQRRVNKADTIATLDRLRSGVKNLAIRTTFITGFPGETDEQFEELVEFVRDQKFTRAGVFTYSYEADTPSARLPDHLSEEVKEFRRERLMTVQQANAFAYNEAQVGRTTDVLLDLPVEGERDVWIGRTTADAPDVDGVVFVTGKHLKAGRIVPTEIVATRDYDLIGAAAGKPR
jgi:ribosomal protein S12 methylthiotransferase